MKTRVLEVMVGLWRPQLQIQITPLCWGFALGVSPRHIGVRVGPVAVAVWFPFNGKVCGFYME